MFYAIFWTTKGNSDGCFISKKLKISAGYTRQGVKKNQGPLFWRKNSSNTRVFKTKNARISDS